MTTRRGKLQLRSAPLRSKNVFLEHHHNLLQKQEEATKNSSVACNFKKKANTNNTL